MFGVSTCAKCNGNLFQVVEQEPAGSNFKLMFVQCSACGTPVGVLDYFNIGSLLDDQKKQLKALDSRVSNIEYTLDQIVRLLKR